MKCERADSKRVRFTGQDIDTGQIRIFLVTVSIASEHAVGDLMCQGHQSGGIRDGIDCPTSTYVCMHICTYSTSSKPGIGQDIFVKKIEQCHHVLNVRQLCTYTISRLQPSAVDAPMMFRDQNFPVYIDTYISRDATLALFTSFINRDTEFDFEFEFTFEFV